MTTAPTMTSRPAWRVLGDRRARVGLAVLAGLGIVATSVAPQLSARLTGDEYLLRVAPVDPIDPFRGAYVALDYPGLPDPSVELDGEHDRDDPVYLLLEPQDDVWHEAGIAHTRPARAPFLRCHDEGWRYRCGIESWFAPQGAAAEAGKALAEKRAVAVVRIDGRGNAALVDLRISTP